MSESPVEEYLAAGAGGKVGVGEALPVSVAEEALAEIIANEESRSADRVGAERAAEAPG